MLLSGIQSVTIVLARAARNPTPTPLRFGARKQYVRDVGAEIPKQRENKPCKRFTDGK